MDDFKTKFKKFISNKLNLTIIISLFLFFVMLLIPCNHVIYIKVEMLLLAVVLFVVAWKLYLKYKKEKEIYDIISYEKQASKTMLGKITDKYNSFGEKSNLIYSIAVALMALFVVISVIFTW